MRKPGSSLLLALRFIILVFFLALFNTARAETKVGSTVESRILLGFKVDEAAAQAWLPEGWAPIILPKGPVAGANLFLVFMDRHLIHDADAEPHVGTANRAAAFLSYGKKDDVEGLRVFLTRVFETAPVVNPYGNSVAARISRKVATEGSEDNKNLRKESWVINPDSGGSITFDLSYEPGIPVWSQGVESTPYSAVLPDFYRIYRYDQLADLAMNVNTGKELKGNASFSVKVPELASVFDGTEELIAIVSIPVFVRDIFLP